MFGEEMVGMLEMLPVGVLGLVTVPAECWIGVVVWWNVVWSWFVVVHCWERNSEQPLTGMVLG